MLVAYWPKGLDAATAPPAAVSWYSGEAATYDDYLSHRDDTSLTLIDPIDGSTRVIMIADICALVFFDEPGGEWKAQPQGKLFNLEIHDPLVDDQELVAEMYTFPISYRFHIDRSKK